MRLVMLFTFRLINAVFPCFRDRSRNGKGYRDNGCIRRPIGFKQFAIFNCHRTRATVSCIGNRHICAVYQLGCRRTAGKHTSLGPFGLASFGFGPKGLTDLTRLTRGFPSKSSDTPKRQITWSDAKIVLPAETSIHIVLQIVTFRDSFARGEWHECTHTRMYGRAWVRYALGCP